MMTNKVATRVFSWLIIFERNFRGVIKTKTKKEKTLIQNRTIRSKITYFKCKHVGYFAAQFNNYKKYFSNYNTDNRGLFACANDSAHVLTISKDKMETLWYVDGACTRNLFTIDSRVKIS